MLSGQSSGRWMEKGTLQMSLALLTEPIKGVQHKHSWICIFVCLEREGGRAQPGGDFKSPSEKVIIEHFIKFNY